MNDRRITAYEFFERLRTIIPGLSNDVISMDIQLRVGLYAVIQETRYANSSDDPKKCIFRVKQDGTIDQALALYNANDFDDVINENKELLAKVKELESKLEILREVDRLDSMKYDKES